VPGLGEVYDARDHEQGRDVSLTVVRTDFAADPDRLERFQRDASAAARLEHPRILTVHNVGADAQAAYIISEPIQGRTLREVRAGGPIPPGTGAPFVPQIAEALAAAHEQGVVHGDLTPDHILFTADGVKVIGFGLAAATGNTEATVSGDLAAFDVISEMLTGTRVEAATGRGWPDVAAAVGVIAFAALIGMWLFGGDDRPASGEPEAVASDPVVTELVVPEPVAPEPATSEPPPSRLPQPEPPVVAVEPAPAPPGSLPAPSAPSRPKPVTLEAAPLSRRADLSAEAPAKAEAGRRRAAPTTPDEAGPRPREIRPAPTSAELEPIRMAVPPPPPVGPSRLVWIDRTGAEEGGIDALADYGHIALSPDGARIAVSIREPGGYNGDIWVIDAGSGSRTRLTSDPADDVAPVWSPDGDRVAFASVRGGSYDIYETASDGTGGDRVLISPPGNQIAYDWTASGRFLLYQTDRPGMASRAHTDLWARRLPYGRAFAFLRSVHRAALPVFSPDGRWVAFTLLASGAETENVYVARFPKYSGRRRVSVNGGSWPRWRSNAIFYVDPENRLVSVSVRSDGVPAAGAPTRISELVVRHGRGFPYDVSADGQRILLNTASEDADAETLGRRGP
jgi:serine/threonine protein kinase